MEGRSVTQILSSPRLLWDQGKQGKHIETPQHCRLHLQGLLFRLTGILLRGLGT